MPRKKRGPKPKSEAEKDKEKGEESEQSEPEKAKATATNNKSDKDEPVKLPFPMKRPRGRPSKKWQEQLALAIAEGRAVPFEKKPKKKKEAGKADKKEKGTAKKDKKENKAPKTPKKDKKEKEEILETKPATPNPQATKTTEKEPVSSQEPVEAAPPPPKKKPSISYLEILQAVLDKLYEYKWPQDETGEYFLLEQQLSDFLGVSLQAKHQDLEFHTIAEEEKEFLKERKIISDGQQSQGVLAIKTDDAAILVMEHYPNKYQDFLQLAHKREKYKLLKKIEDEKTIKEGKKIPNPLKRALKDVVDFNAQLALQRREERCSYFDMQTQIIHYPVNKMSKLPNHMTVPSKYPVALLPGQFQEYYKSYSPVMMRSFPLGTVIDSSKHNQTCDSRSSLTGGSSDSSEESSSSSSSGEDDSDDDDDDDDSSVSEASGDQKMSENEEEEVSEPPAKRRALGYKPPHRPDALCGICLRGRESNKKGLMEELIHCSQCENSGHPSCLDMSPQLVKVIITYPWQCMECKTCTQCRDPFDEDKMLFCDECDRGYHSFCVGLKQIPVGRWTCELCGVCASCLRRTPGEGPNSRWKSEYTKPRDKSEPQFLQTLCSPCSRLFRSGNFCPVCLKVYRNDESDLPMVCCDECDRWIHTDCDDIDEKSYAELSKEKAKYRCILCRGEKEERMDSFARKNRDHEVSQDE